MYWNELFTEQNKENGYPFRLDSAAKLFFRERSLKEEDTVIHKKGTDLVNKTYVDEDGNVQSLSDEKYRQACENPSFPEFEHKLSIRKAPHDIVKDKRYLKNAFKLHITMSLNSQASNKASEAKGIINSKVLSLAKSNSLNFLGIDRGERNLLYLSLIDCDGNILEQKSLNLVRTVRGDNVFEYDFRSKLDLVERQRDSERKSWDQISRIKDLKNGYLSLVVREIADYIIENNAIVIMEDLNFGFKRGRTKVEKQVYQKFENQLVSKLSYICNKDSGVQNKWGLGGIANGLQLVPPLDKVKNIGDQFGCIFYVPAWKTSKIDPTTGFMNQFRFYFETKAKWRVFFNSMDSIVFNKDEDYFEFDFRYSNFGDMAQKDFTDRWVVCSAGKGRLFTLKHESSWETFQIDVNQEFKNELEHAGIDYLKGKNIKEEVARCNYVKRIGWLFKRLLDLRYSCHETNQDFILSPVKNTDGLFFDSRRAKSNEPCDADANGAFHIALKGLQLIKNLTEMDGDLRSKKLDKSNDSWNRWVQDFHHSA